MSFYELLRHARQKPVGMDDYWLAIALQRVRKVKLWPRMIKPPEIDDLLACFLDLAQDLMSDVAS